MSPLELELLVKTVSNVALWLFFLIYMALSIKLFLFDQRKKDGTIAFVFSMLLLVIALIPTP